jgi:pimeloyl-ACP methyl ester carboxylesterase
MSTRLSGSAFVLVALLATLGILSPSGRAAEPPQDASPPLPGKHVDIGGYRLYLSCSGNGQPTVVLLSGMGDTASIWDRVQPEVAKFTRVCAYDRAGEGKSEPSPARRTLQQSVNELHRLLLAARVPGPYVLVGASYGGLIARIYASQHPELVAGMVFVDSAHEDTILMLNGKVMQPRTMSLEEWRALTPRTPEEERRFGDLREDLTLVHDSRENREYPLGDLPLLVLSHSAGGQPLASVPGSPFTAEQLDAEGKRTQADLARLSRRGRQIVVAKSGHTIHRDAPAAVVAAIREVVEAARHSGQQSASKQRRHGRQLPFALSAPPHPGVGWREFRLR